MPSGLKRTLSHAAVYGAGNAIQSAAAFIMLPIYTRYLTPADYGTVSMMQILLDITGLVFGMQIATAVFRHYYQEKDALGRQEVVSTALAFTVLSKGIGALALSLLAGPSSLLVFGQAGMEQYVALFAFALLTDSLAFIPMQYMRILERPFMFVGTSLAKLLVQLALNLWFIVHLEMGVLGVIYGAVLSGAIVGGALCLWLLAQTGLHFRLSRARQLLVYTWPLIGTGLLSIGMASGNRLVLTHFHGLSQVGLLSLGAQFASVLRTLIWQPFNQVWAPQRFKLIGAPDAEASFTRGFRVVASTLLVAGTGIAVLTEDVLHLMSDAAFAGSAAVVPMLVLAELVRCMTMFSNTPLLVADRTVELLRANMIAGAVLLVSLLLVVPRYGLMGAAWASALSMLAAMWWTVHKARQQQDLGLPWHHFWMGVGLAVATTLLAQLAPSGLVPSVLSKLALLLAFTLALVWSPLLGRELRSAFMALVRSRLGGAATPGARG